jgi:hypothetical protein
MSSERQLCRKKWSFKCFDICDNADDADVDADVVDADVDHVVDAVDVVEDDEDIRVSVRM